MRISCRPYGLKVNSSIIYLIPGFLFLIMAVIGVVMPVIPTFPFLLIALWCFAKSSDSLNQRIRNSFLGRKYIWELNFRKGMILRNKLKILVPVIGLLCILFVLSDNMIVRTMIVLAVVIKTVVFIRIKTIH